jgi:D-glycero-alpha-D-manno-heptose-7-phosphate kinase
MVITKTPYRLSLFGGGTDYPSWFETHPSKVIAAAMANYCYLTVKKLPPFFEYGSRVIYSKIESVQEFSEIEHPSARACLQYFDMPGGFSITHDGDLPARSGIGSSSSFTVGLLHALHAIKGGMISKEKLAQLAIHVEQNMIGESVGIQDQIMASYGGIRVIQMGPGNKWVSEPLVLSDDYMKEFESHVMLGFSGVSRYAETMAKKKVDQIKRGDSYYYLNDINDLTYQALDAFTDKKDMSEIGKLLQQGWTLKRQLAEGITEMWIDDIYNEAIRAGALGGKLMGAGGGGFFFFLVPPEKQEQFKEDMQSIKVWVPFKFDTQGSQIVLYS